RSSPTISSSDFRLSRMVLRSINQRSSGSVSVLVLLRCQVVVEPLADLVRGAREVQFEGEPLFVAVAAVYVLQVDSVERAFGGPDHATVLGGDVLGDLERRGVEF